MKDYIVRKIRSKYKDKYKYQYFDKKDNLVDPSIIKVCLQGLYIPPAHEDVKINLNKKARIVYVRKEIGIEFRLGYERAWSAISRAVEKSDFRVIDRNRELRYIQLSLNNPTTTRFFNFFGSPEENNADVDYELTFTTVGENTLLEFKKVSDTAVSVNEIVDEINENLS